MLATITRWCCIFANLGCLVIPGFLSAQKNDTVYLLNGDKITGEIKQYASGLLVLKTDGMSTVNIEYDKVKTFHSAKYFEIVKKTGFSYFGSFARSTTDLSVSVVVGNDTVTELIIDIVGFTPIKNRFWSKFDGSVDLGLSYYKSTNTLQYYFNGDVTYRSRKDQVRFGMDLFFSEQEISDSLIFSRKNDIELDYNHFFQGRWWGGIGSKWQRNTELDLDYRLQLGFGAGYDVVHTNPVRFYVMGALLVNREQPVDSVSFSTNFESLLSLKFTWVQYRHPKINIATNFDIYPSLSVKNRYRIEYNFSAKYEVFKDFFMGLTYYDNFDNKPTGGGTSLNDWSAVLTVGYSF